MKMNKTFATGLGAVALSLGSLALGAVDAQAATLSYSGNLFSNVSTATTGSAALLQFDSALGTLTGVTISSSVTGTASLSVFNATGSAQSFTNGSASFNFTLTSPSVVIASVAAATGISGSVSSAFGSTTFAGPPINVTGSSSVAPANFAAYIGNGTTTVTATGNVGNGAYTGSAAAGVFFGGSSILSADATITYTYDAVVPPSAVPEPLTMLGAATAVGFGAAFKRRALKNAKKG